jgi:hypothetical protein
MEGSFKPVSADRAALIRKMLDASRDPNVGIRLDPKTGAAQGTGPLSQVDPEKVNMIGKFDTHYLSGGAAWAS